MASGWNLWVWLQCIGVVSGCCKEVYRFPHNITYPYSTCIFGSNIPTSLFIFKNVFFVLVYVIFVQYSKHCSKNIRDRKKSRSCGHGDIIISTRTYVGCTRARVPRLPCARYR